MAYLNKVLLIGNLGRDPETRYLPSGGAVCNFSIATTDRWKDKDGNQQEKTEWHNITAYNRLAEVCGEFLSKGSSVYVEGKLQTRKWQDKQTGADRYTTEIIIDKMQMLGGKREGGGQQQERESGHGPEQAPTAQRQSQQSAPPANRQPARGFDDFEDDIPF